MDNINEIIGQNLLRLRKEKKLTQLELAEKFNYSDKSISKWEKGESLPNIEVLYDLAKFYEVSLDDLVKNTDITAIPKIEQVPEKHKISPTSSLVVTLMAASGVWFFATILYVILLLTMNVYYSLCFMWAIPLTCIVLIIFNSIWGHYRYLFPILTLLLWSSLACTQLQVLEFGINIWPIFFLGIPLQVGVILWGALLLSHKKRLNKESLALSKNTQTDKTKINDDEPKAIDEANIESNIDKIE